MLSPGTKRNIERIIPFGLIWLTFSLVYSLLERGLLGRLTAYPSTGNPYHFSSTGLVTAITGLVIGLLIGTIEIMYLYKLFSKKSLSKKIIYKTLVYLLIIIAFLIITTAINNCFELKTHIFNPLVWHNVWLFFFSYSFWSVCVYIATILGISLFYIEISDNLGHGVLTNFFTGKYHAPKEEERIFMFLDMASSTTIAEKLGHIQYFEMLRDYYADLSDPVIQYSGEIYQYVGDELVVSWTLENGLSNNNCIRCFFALKEAMRKQAGKYQKKFAVVPGFKAALHLGKVTTGEIGVIKKEIIFTGDVLNTTARIQGLCNEYKVDIIISGTLAKQLDLTSQFATEALGENQLRGRHEKMALFTIFPVEMH